MKQKEQSDILQRLFECAVCNIGFPRPNSLRKHVEMCNKVKNNNNIERDDSRFEKGQKLVCCNICSKKFTSLYDLKRHDLIHTGEKPFSCRFCAKKFRHTSSLKNHELIHTDEKPHSCQYCSKKFRTSGNQRIHEARHTDKNSKLYQQNQLLQIHVQDNQKNQNASKMYQKNY